MAKSSLCRIKELGQSVWLDFITRDFLRAGSFAKLVNEDCISGVTVNPTIFEQSVVGSDAYDEDIETLLHIYKYTETEDIYHDLIISDVVEACRHLLPVFGSSLGYDGFVSMEVAPKYAFDPQKTLNEVRELAAKASKPNIMIKIPGTPEGIKAIRQATAEGYNINITLLFSPKQYLPVANAFMDGIEERISKNQPVANLVSVASLFVSRIDTMVDKIIDEKLAKEDKDSVRLKNIRGTIGSATAKKTYQVYLQVIKSERSQNLEAQGVRPQRVLWGSTSTKDAAYSDVKYVEALIGDNTINTMPLKTIDAFRDHGRAEENLTKDLDKADKAIASASRLGINLEDIYFALQKEGVQKFDDSYKHLFSILEQKRRKLAA